jgi:hypothetical protein
LKNALKLILTVIVLSYIVDKVIYYSIDTIGDEVLAGDRLGKLNHFYKIKDTTSVLIFGSSRANHNLDLKNFRISSSFNMGKDGTSLAYFYTLMSTLPIDTKQTILLHIDSRQIFEEKYDGKDIYGLTTKYHKDDIIRREINALGMNSAFQNLYWTTDYNGIFLYTLISYFKPEYDYKEYDGYDPIVVDSVQKIIFKRLLQKKESKISPLLVRYMNENCPAEYQPDSLSLSYLNKIISLCKNNNKSLIVFTSPFYNDNCKSDNIELARIFEENQIPYYDFSDFFKNTNSITYWKDYIHLSDKGASVFSAPFFKEIEKEIWR